MSPPESAVDPARAALTRARRVVIKVGSSLVAASPMGRPAALADEIAALRRGPRAGVDRGDAEADPPFEAVVVSSGAIALGRRVLGLARRPTEMPVLQAAAAVGQSRLMHAWEQAFGVHQLCAAQVLLTHDDLADRGRFLSARHALRAMLAAGAVPVVNENDTVAVEEIQYGDNDLLAALICNLVSADALIILTDVDGVHDAPRARAAGASRWSATPISTAARSGAAGACSAPTPTGRARAGWRPRSRPRVPRPAMGSPPRSCPAPGPGS